MNKQPGDNDSDGVYRAHACRAGGEIARADGGFDVVRIVVEAVGVEVLEVFALQFKEQRPNGTRAEFTRYMIGRINAIPTRAAA